MVINQLVILSGGGHEASRGDFIHLPGKTLAVFMDHPYCCLCEDLAGGFDRRQRK
jgi:hypothetical protein